MHLHTYPPTYAHTMFKMSFYYFSIKSSFFFFYVSFLLGSKVMYASCTFMSVYMCVYICMCTDFKVNKLVPVKTWHNFALYLGAEESVANNKYPKSPHLFISFVCSFVIYNGESGFGKWIQIFACKNTYY